MALLLLCPYTEPFWPRKRSVAAMAIAAEPHCRPRHQSHNILFGHQYSSSCSCFRYICHSITLGNVLRLAIHVRNRSSIQRCGVMSMVKDNSSAEIRGKRRVVWTVETELEAGELLYVTGEPSVLGGWESDMAILMSSTEHANLWKAEVQIASGVSFKYNYFIKGETSPYDVIWRPGPEFSLSVPHSVKRDDDVVVRDSWVRSTTKQSSKHSLISWIEDSYFQIQPSITKQEIDGDGALSQLKSDSMESKLASDLVTSFLEPISDRSMIERYQPVEEPWLLQSPIFSTVSEDKMVSDVSVINEHVLDERERLEDTGKLLQEGKRDSISTMILINSSICTMQRIAVLEDGQLVELLLEPVKNNVLCDSVYLGIVTKLVPHMGGALVNIGGSRPSLMDIKPTREPFIFPPFRHETITPVNGVLVDLEISDRMSGVASQEEREQAVQDEDEENDSEDELDESEMFAHDVSGSSADNGELEADCEDDIEGRGETVANSFYANMNVSVPFEMPNLPDLRGSGNAMTNKNMWSQVKKGTRIIVQVVKEGLGTKGPTLTAYPKLRSRFWVMITRCDRIGISKKISGVERTRLKVIAKTLQPKGFGLTVRTVAAGCSLVELQKDLEALLSTWKNIMEQAKSASLAADEGVEGAVPVILHTAMGQTLSVVQDYFNEKVEKMIVDSARTYYEVTNYLQDISPGLCDRVELHTKRIPLFDEFNVEEEINNILSKRVLLANGGSLVIEQTEALVSIDVNGGHVMFGQGNSQEKAILDVNLAAANQIARELRLRDIGGIIVVDFIDMVDESNKRLVYEEVKNAVERDRSMVKVSELSKHGLMEITRKRVRPSVTFMISEPCSCCHATGRVEALETSFSKIEQEISRLLATVDQKVILPNPKFWPKFMLRVDHHMCEYLTSGKRTRLALLSSSLKVWILLKVARGFTRGTFEVKPFAEDKGSENQRQVTIPVLRTGEAKNVNPGKKVTIIPVKKWKTGRK